MPSDRPELPPPVAYLLVLAFQLAMWLGAGLGWGASMVLLAGWGPAAAVAGGLRWGLVMWVLVGNLVAIGLAWRRSGEIPAPDRAAFRAALRPTCDKLRLAVLAESPDEVVLGPRRVLVRFRLQEVRVHFAGDTAVLTAPALSFGVISKELRRAMAVAPSGER